MREDLPELGGSTEITAVLLHFGSNCSFFLSSFLPWKLIFLSAESSKGLLLLADFQVHRDQYNADFFQALLEFFYQFPNLSFKIF